MRLVMEGQPVQLDTGVLYTLEIEAAIVLWSDEPGVHGLAERSQIIDLFTCDLVTLVFLDHSEERLTPARRRVIESVISVSSVPTM